MKAAFIINDFKSMNLEKDTSIFLIKEAQKMDMAGCINRPCKEIL